MQKNVFGRSMIEMLGVLAIIGVLSIGGLMGYRQAQLKMETNQILNLIATFRLVTKENPESGIPPSKKICDEKLLDDDFCVKNSYSSASYNLPFGVKNQCHYWDTNALGTNPYTRLMIIGIPVGVCKNVLSYPNVSDYKQGGARMIQIGNEIFTAPFSISTLQAKCEDSNTPGGWNGNTLNLYFYRKDF